MAMIVEIAANLARESGALPTITSAPPTIRRFELPDLDRHGGWIMKRLMAAYPHLTDRTVVGWLKGQLYSSECMFLYAEHGCAMAELERARPMCPEPLIREVFVFAHDGHIEAASWFYQEFARWAKHHGGATLIVEEGLTDVPHEMIKDRLGGKRMFTRQQVFVKV